MALYQIDCRGPHYDDLRAGMVASTIANIHRNEKVRRKPFSPLEFAPWNEHHRLQAAPEPILLPDKDAQSRLIENMMFPRRE